MKVILDRDPSQAAKDFTLKLTEDMARLLARTFDVMIIELGPKESLNVMLTVLALACVSTARGGGADIATFKEYIRLADTAINARLADTAINAKNAG